MGEDYDDGGVQVDNKATEIIEVVDDKLSEDEKEGDNDNDKRILAPKPFRRDVALQIILKARELFNKRNSEIGVFNNDE